MKIFPAIDLKGGEAVRLTQGDYNKVKVYFKNPEDILEYFKKNENKYLHIVDLDGASSGKLENFNTIEKLAKGKDFFIQVGGGIRDEDRIKKYLDLGIDRVILGTVAIENPDFLNKMVTKYKKKIAVGVDAKNQKVAVNGWKNVAEVDSLDFCKTLSDMGVDNIIYTDISKDGNMSGTNIDVYKKLSKLVKSKITASGGITYKEEITELKKLDLYGAIVGKAIYENVLDLKELIKLA